LVGNFTGTVDYDFSSQTTTLTSGAAQSAYIAKYLDASGANTPIAQSALQTVNVYSRKDEVIVDLTTFEKANADIKVIDLLGRTIFATTHSRNDMLSIDLSSAPSQVYVVIVNNGGITIATKVWVE
jgi:hypothetical protein